MRVPKFPMTYEQASDADVLEAYIHKNDGYNRAGARKIKRALHKLQIT